jgi:hypothetical protein
MFVVMLFVFVPVHQIRFHFTHSISVPAPHTQFAAQFVVSQSLYGVRRFPEFLSQRLFSRSIRAHTCAIFFISYVFRGHIASQFLQV